jgi:AAA ATPase domain
VHDRVPDADPEDLLLLDDLLGIADPEVELPKIDPDARRRRLTALVNAASLARTEPAVFVIEDVHWIDEVSESLLAEFLMVIPQTPSLVLATFRPEYRGALSRVAGAKTIALAPLSDPETAAREPWSANTCRGSHRLPSIHRATARRRPVRTCAAHLAITGISPRSPREEHLNGTTAISRAPRKPWPMMSC